MITFRNVLTARRKTRTQYSADELVRRLLGLSRSKQICLADSCGVSHLGSRFLIAGIGTTESEVFVAAEPSEALRLFNTIASNLPHFSFFTISYDLGPKLENLYDNRGPESLEPDLYLRTFKAVVIYDYRTGCTFLLGDEGSFDEIEGSVENAEPFEATTADTVGVKSNFTRAEYIRLVEEIRESIRCGETYQTNLTQQLTAHLPVGLSPADIFDHLRTNHPAPFGSFIDRGDSVVVSASPERFFRVFEENNRRVIQTSPIKGTRPRGSDPASDDALRRELLESAKDRAENVMIVDLLRNDLGRICDFGSVEVEKLCDLEEHPSLFHLVSTVRGVLRDEITPAQILRAVFPCGSITGAPKINTMKIIGRIENRRRGLSMGAIGFAGPAIRPFDWEGELPSFEMDLAVAIRTMTIRDGSAVFNVGGGIVSDSDAAREYDETLTKATALLRAINGKLSAEQN